MARAKRVAEAVRSAVEARPWALGALAAGIAATRRMRASDELSLRR